ncbi:hypothetical protein [Candidatus Cardinium sp. cByotN1]|uniref:hypothetical protein n=1 Tax=Candidatus Cardinium sp. cByotN1 TaxID=2699439 RepID=UPI001FB4E32F|nr:hypothetical protein [Candidatus Cardinium sp. cByotN1]
MDRVKLYQNDLQNIADGAVSNTSKKTIRLHNEPIIWCSNYQITGEGGVLAY